MSDIQIILSGIPKSSKTQYFTVEIPPNSPVSMMLNIPYSKVTTQTTGTQTTIQKSVTQSATKKNNSQMMMGEEEAGEEEEAMAGEEEASAMGEEEAMVGEEEAAMAGEEGAMEEEESAPVSQPSKSFSLSARPSQGQLSERQSAILSLLNSPSNSSSNSMSSPNSMSSSQTPFTLSVKSSQPPKTIGQTLTQLSAQQPKQSQKPLQANPGPSMREIATNLKMAKPLVTIQRATQQNPIQQNPIQQEYNFVTNRVPTNNNNGPKYSDSKIKFSMSNASLANNKQTQQIYI